MHDDVKSSLFGLNENNGERGKQPPLIDSYTCAGGEVSSHTDSKKYQRWNERQEGLYCCSSCLEGGGTDGAAKK